MSFLKKIGQYIGKVDSAIEFFLNPNKDDENFEKYINNIYEASFKEIDKKKPEWDANKKAYMAKSVPFLTGAGAIFTDSATAEIYCSSIVADKIEDLASIQVAGKPVAYPLPKITKDYDYALVMPKDSEDAPVDIVRKAWQASFKDLQERRCVHELNYQIAVESRLFDYSVVKITQEYDFEIQDEDVAIELCHNQDVGFDPQAKSPETARWVNHRKWFTPYETVSKFPDMAEEIMSAMDGTEGDGRDADDHKDQVCVVECYLKDLTLEEDDATEKGFKYKYPYGRRITFLAGKKQVTILEDVPNPYKHIPFIVFAPRPVSWEIGGRNEASPLRALQAIDDFVFQQLIANMKKFGGGCMVYDRKGVVDPESIRGMVGEMIPVDYLGSINFDISKDIPRDAQIVHGMIMEMARDISGVESPSEGRAPGSIQTGIGVSLLQEASNRKVKPSRDIYGEAYQKMWKQIADIMIDLYEEGRRMRVSEMDNLPSELPFDLAVVTDSIDVMIDSDTALPNDPVSIVNLALSLFQLRDENDIPIIDREFLSEWLRIPGLQDAIARIEQKTMEQFQREQEMAMMGSAEGSPEGGIPQGADFAPTNQMMGMQETNMSPGVGGQNIN